MSRLSVPAMAVGNDFVVPQPKLRVAASAVSAPAAVVVEPAVIVSPGINFGEAAEQSPGQSLFGKTLDYVHRYSLGVFALLFLLVASSAVEVGSAYWKATISLSPAKSAPRALVQPIKGPNTAVRSEEQAATLQKITGQNITISVADKPVTVSAETIKNWLKVTENTGVAYIHVDQAAITKSLNEAVAPYIKAPVNQVDATNPDGTTHTLSAGKNGTKLGDITPITKQVGDYLLTAKGMQLNVPTETQAFGIATPASFDKLLEVNVNTKQMWAYEKGQLVKTFPISAGAPATPTPIGQFQIYQKLTVQDMRGYNANGTKYFQPHVRWINYFLPGGYAVHGNYWRPLSWFGAVNSSHGCVSLPDDQAKWVYDWAPIGTTVITHN